MPAATGSVALKNKDQNNKTLIVTAHHLAPPEDLNTEALGQPQTPAHSYVVWMQPTDTSPPENIGVLVPDKNLDAELTTTTPRARFNIFVTPEPSPTQNAPTGKHLLEATVSP